MPSWLLAGTAIGYLAILFAIAAYGDRNARGRVFENGRPLFYALSLAIYCTSWTFYGSVGVASQRGFEFFAIYVGPILVFTVGLPLVRRIVAVSQAERITSIADFLGARFGKNGAVAAITTLIAVVGIVPYIALQLKAIAASVTLLAGAEGIAPAFPVDISVAVALTLIVFATLFGTRHADATEHQDGLILAIAIESVVKLVAFIAVGVFITFVFNGGYAQIASAFENDETVRSALAAGTSINRWIVLIILSGGAILLLPRQFHVTVVEYRARRELTKARWLFPLYLIAINLLVMPIAVSGIVNIGTSAPSDLYILALPLEAGSHWLALLTFVGGLSAATAMVIVACVALSIMISNDLVLPVTLRRQGVASVTNAVDVSRKILNIRRIAIAAVIIAATYYQRFSANDEQLAAMGLLSFAAVTQFLPAFLLGMYWRGANARGAIMGLLLGFAVWGFTLLLPALSESSDAILTEGLFGVAALRPQSLFGLAEDPLVNGVFWSLLLNVSGVVLGSLSRAATPLERMQAVAFVPRGSEPATNARRYQNTVSVGELRRTLARYVGNARMVRAFDTFQARESRQLLDTDNADLSLIRYTEQILGSAVGASSARLILSLVMDRDDLPAHQTAQLLDDASTALLENRDVLQKALNQMDQGISVFDREFQLTNWNTQFRRLLELPPHLGNFGIALKTVTDHLAENGQITRAQEDEMVKSITQSRRAWQLPLAKSGRILEIRSNPMPDGGLVVTYTDITGRVEADEALKRTKESLEVRVQARTWELTKVNAELAKAQTRAEDANVSKTRFLAAAGHDISQPLNAARLYASSLVEKMERENNGDREIVAKIDSALDSVETIIGAVLDISRLDAGAMEPRNSLFGLGDLLEQVRIDFQPQADKKNLRLSVVPSSIVVETDRNLLRRLVQNLLSNAIKYTKSGRVLMGVRRRGRDAEIWVVDTGIGIADNQRQYVFREFQRLNDGAQVASGLGLGLSIVERISRVLGCEITMNSRHGHGTSFIVRMAASDKKPLAEIAARGPLAPSQSLLTGLRVACVDNEEAILAGMTVLLSGWGAQVTTATGYAQLCERLDALEKQPHVLVADYHLDGENGLDVIAAIRERYDDTLECVLITADRSNEIRIATEKADIQLLNKPLKPAALRALLTTVPVVRDAAE